MGKIICIFNIHRKTEGGYSMRIYRLCNIIISYSNHTMNRTAAGALCPYTYYRSSYRDDFSSISFVFCFAPLEEDSKRTPLLCLVYRWSNDDNIPIRSVVIARSDPCSRCRV